MTEVVRLVLAAVFVVAGVAKLFDREGSRRAASAFGAPGWIGVVLPLVEIGVALLLVPTSTARAAAAAAAALLVLFSAAIANALLRGRRPDCHCFGRLHSAPAGWRTLARNAALAGVAVALAFQPASRPTWIELAAAGIVLVIAAQLILSLVLLRRYGRALGRIEELETRPARRTLEVGAEAPPFTLTESDGAMSTLEGLLARAKPVLLVFTSSGCGPCVALRPRIAEWKEQFSDELTVVLLEDERIVADWYDVEATPSAVLVGTDGKIAQPLVAGGGAIEELVGSLTPERERTPEPRRNGQARVAAAAALAGGLAATTVAHASSHETTALDPEIKAIDEIIRAAGPRLVAAARRSAGVAKVPVAARRSAPARAKARKASSVALAAQHKEVLALRTRLDKLEVTGPVATNIKTISLRALSLMAQSLETRQRAVFADPKHALRLNDQAERLLSNSLDSVAAAATLRNRAVG